MLKILNKIQFSKEENKMKSIGNVEAAIKLFKESKSKNLKFLLKKICFCQVLNRCQNKNFYCIPQRQLSNHFDIIAYVLLM